MHNDRENLFWCVLRKTGCEIAIKASLWMLCGEFLGKQHFLNCFHNKYLILTVCSSGRRSVCELIHHARERRWRPAADWLWLKPAAPCWAFHRQSPLLLPISQSIKLQSTPEWLPPQCCCRGWVLRWNNGEGLLGFTDSNSRHRSIWRRSVVKAKL